MRTRKGNGRRANGEARTHELLERIAEEISAMRKEFTAEIRATNKRLDETRRELKAEIHATNERIDHLIDILAPKLKDHEGRITRLEKAA